MASKTGHKATVNYCSECGKKLKFKGNSENPLICWDCAVGGMLGNFERVPPGKIWPNNEFICDFANDCCDYGNCKLPVNLLRHHYQQRQDST